jgi:hypothetical protein
LKIVDKVKGTPIRPGDDIPRQQRSRVGGTSRYEFENHQAELAGFCFDRLDRDAEC